MGEIISSLENEGYREIGDVPDFEGKHSNIERLSDFGLEVPQTLVVGEGAQKEDFSSWAEEMINEGNELMLRSDFGSSANRRNAPSIRDATQDVEDIWGKVTEFFKKNSLLDPIVIVQAIEPNSINRDVLSANIHFKKEYNKIEMRIEASPDIAVLINRLNLTPTIVKKDGDFTINKSPRLWDTILYRVGRDENKKLGIKLPKIEELEEDFNKRYEEVIEKGRNALKENPEQYSGPSYWNSMWNENFTSIPNEIIEIINKEENRIRKKVSKDSFVYSSGMFKMSFIKSPDGSIEPMYWDIIEGQYTKIYE
jgi:hypothetical protein